MNAIIVKLFKTQQYHIIRTHKMSAYDFKGVPLKKIYRGPNEWHLKHFPPIENRRNHAVLFELPLEADSTTPPKPHQGEMKWDSSHVKLPCASQNDYKTESGSDPSKIITGSRWEIIEQALLRDINSSRELERAILTYNTKYSKEWKFKSLHTLFEQELDEDEAESFFRKTLPDIIGLALQLPQLIKCSIPLLKRGQNRSISLSQLQIACLLANAFLCTFPRRNEKSRHSEYFNYPSINFSTLFQTPGDQNIEKIKCICNYFRRVCSKNPVGVVTFTRRSVPESELPEWDNCQKTFADSMLYVSDDGTIEDDGSGLLQVDFANKFLGGGVLNYGCVQEEIRFMICPELLCSRLFTEVLEDNECLLIMGCERFNEYSGYASTFMWTGDYRDSTPCDSFRRRKCSIVAIDAIPFKHKATQYKDEMLLRELNKAYVGFKPILDGPALGVATGNWGCGAFNGDKHLKSLLQLMACHINDRPLAYFTFGDEQLRDDIFTIYEYLKENKVKIAELWTYLLEYAGYRSRNIHLYNFIIEHHQEPKDSKSSTNGHCSKQANRSADRTPIKPKPISTLASKHPPKSDFKQTDSDDELLAETMADVESKQYLIEDPDVDDQFQEDEILKSLDQSRAEEQKQRIKKTQRDGVIEAQRKSPNEKRSLVDLPSDYPTAKTVSSFFPKAPSNATEKTDNQDKRPRSLLLQCLEEGYNKSPSKVKRSTITTIKTVISTPNTSADAKAEAKSDAKREDEMEVDENILTEDSEYETATEETNYDKDEPKDDLDQHESSTMSIDLAEEDEEQMDVSNHDTAAEPNVERKEKENKTPVKDNVQSTATDDLNESSSLEPVKSANANSPEGSNVFKENEVKEQGRQGPTVDESIMTDDESDSEVLQETNHLKSLNVTPDKTST